MSEPACHAVLDSYDSQHRCSGAANHDGPHRCEVCPTPRNQRLTGATGPLPENVPILMDVYCPLTCPVDTCSGWCDGEARHRGQHWCCNCDAEWD